MSEKRWYNSSFFSYLGAGIAIGAICIGGGIGIRECTGFNKHKAEVDKYKAGIEAGYKLQEANLIGDVTPEKFYVIGNQIAVTSLDGKPVLEYLEEKVSEE